jgi:hypothetical protein
VRLVVPVFPEISVAMTVMRLGHDTRLERVFDQLPVPSVARTQFTVTLAIPPVSDTRPERRGVPVTVSLSICDVILTIGAVVSVLERTCTIRETYTEVFPAVSVFQYSSV